nr:MAG TPA: hypothetical protein [Caudoviricetes sp.]
MAFYFVGKECNETKKAYCFKRQKNLGGLR